MPTRPCAASAPISPGLARIKTLRLIPARLAICLWPYSLGSWRSLTRRMKGTTTLCLAPEGSAVWPRWLPRETGRGPGYYCSRRQTRPPTHCAHSRRVLPHSFQRGVLTFPLNVWTANAFTDTYNQLKAYHTAPNTYPHKQTRIYINKSQLNTRKTHPVKQHTKADKTNSQARLTTFKLSKKKEDDEASFEEPRPSDHSAFHKTAGQRTKNITVAETVRITTSAKGMINPESLSAHIPRTNV